MTMGYWSLRGVFYDEANHIKKIRWIASLSFAMTMGHYLPLLQEMFYLKVTQLTKSYTSKVLVDHVDFTISKGQKIALVAKNGAGKSTLLKLLMKEIDLTD
jgi:ABC-type multidrug transport system fused ATPase/permease subunit